VRIAVDIDSTLHDYWVQFSAIAKRRFGVELAYETQLTWEIGRLRPEQARACVAESHTEPYILAAEPYPGAVETIRAWHEAGHFIQVTSHRTTAAHDATARWLDQVGLPYDDLYCSFDKITRCVELGIDVLVDDSPVNLENAREQGILGATIIHPWNAGIVDQERIIGGADWSDLAQRLETVLRA
jgi:uncharacterized protein